MNNTLLYRYVDLTSLKEDDTLQSIKLLCERGIQHQVAAICVYPQFVAAAKKNLAGSHINIVTVANFPTGLENETHILNTIDQALQDGADEIDVVFPYSNYLTSEKISSLALVRRCKETCGQKTLKVIVESGAFSDDHVLLTVCQEIIDNGADFLKTSTGKIPIGATLNSAKILLEAIKSTGNRVGFKASGGIRTFAAVQQYKALAETLLTPAWVTTRHFRIGTNCLI